MLFTTPIFLMFFLPAVLIGYFIISYRMRNIWLLVSSFLFFAWGEPIFPFIILSSAFFDYCFCKLMHKYEHELYNKKIIAAIAILQNLFLLAYYKYSNFFFENINFVLGNLHIAGIQWSKIMLPLGVSFLVFEKITYIVDNYQNIRVNDSFIDYLTYVFLFPKLLAGPIVKFHEISGQLKKRFTNINNVYFGINRFIIGLCKKVFIADTMAEYVDKVFSLPVHELSTGTAWFAALCFTIQIYFDFSGYSDMAIGIAKVLGFNLMENFNMPYIASNFTEFWRRWHISLSTWIKEYIYIPLGGNRVSTFCTYRNLLIAFFLSGLWHGANWTYIIWGLYHGLFLVMDRLGLAKIQKKLPKCLNVGITFTFIVIGWVIFRAQNIGYAFNYIKRMFIYAGQGEFIYITDNIYFFFILSLLCIFIPLLRQFNEINACFQVSIHKNFQWSIVNFFLLLLGLAKVFTTTFNPFLYFRF